MSYDQMKINIFKYAEWIAFCSNIVIFLFIGTYVQIPDVNTICTKTKIHVPTSTARCRRCANILSISFLQIDTYYLF